MITNYLIMLSFFTVPRGIHLATNRDMIITDVSQDCSNNYSSSIFLSYGNGYTDARIILLRSVGDLIRNCSLLVVTPYFQNSCKEQCVTIVVVELLNYYQSSNLSCMPLTKGGVFTISEQEGKFENICQDVNRTKKEILPYIVRKKKFTVELRFTNFSGEIKLTITSARYVGNYGNCTDNEIYCILDGQIICINKLLECDGHLNCGTPGLYDEYCTNLHVQENIMFAIVYGSCLLAVIMFFFVQILRMCVPTVADHFFEFKEGEEYKFVLTSQSLPPVELYTLEEETEGHRVAKATETQIY